MPTLIELLDENEAVIETIEVGPDRTDDALGDLRIFLKVEPKDLDARKLRIGDDGEVHEVNEDIAATLRSFPATPGQLRGTETARMIWI